MNRRYNVLTHGRKFTCKYLKNKEQGNTDEIECTVENAKNRCRNYYLCSIYIKDHNESLTRKMIAKTIRDNKLDTTKAPVKVTKEKMKENYYLSSTLYNEVNPEIQEIEIEKDKKEILREFRARKRLSKRENRAHKSKRTRYIKKRCEEIFGSLDNEEAKEFLKENGIKVTKKKRKHHWNFRDGKKRTRKTNKDISKYENAPTLDWNNNTTTTSQPESPEVSDIEEDKDEDEEIIFTFEVVA